VGSYEALIGGSTPWAWQAAVSMTPTTCGLFQLFQISKGVARMSWSELQPFQHVPILSHDELHLNVSHVEGSHRAALDGAVDT